MKALASDSYFRIKLTVVSINNVLQIFGRLCSQCHWVCSSILFLFFRCLTVVTSVESGATLPASVMKMVAAAVVDTKEEVVLEVDKEVRE